jgi:hypothetical protein
LDQVIDNIQVEPIVSIERILSIIKPTIVAIKSFQPVQLVVSITEPAVVATKSFQPIQLVVETLPIEPIVF